MNHKQFSSMSGWDIAKLLGCEYTGDANPIDHGGTFYDTRDWIPYGYASCVEFWRDPETDDIVVECGTINKTDDVVKCYTDYSGWKLTPDGKLDMGYGDPIEITPQVEIESVLSCWRFEPLEDFGGLYVQRFPDGTDEDYIWESVYEWLEALGG